MTASISTLKHAWRDIAPVLNVRNAREYRVAVARLDALLDDGADATRHPLHGLLHALGLAMRAYEERHVDIPDAAPRDVLALLMQQHGCRQGDLANIAPQSVISELLNGRREFNVRHVSALSRRFGVPPEVFLPAGPVETTRVAEERARYGAPRKPRRMR